MSNFPFSLKESMSKISASQLSSIQQKLNKLAERLRTTYNMELRDDSRLAWIYATVLPESELDFTCRELWYVKLLYDHTPYKDMCQDNLPLIKHSLVYNQNLSPDESWDHIQNYVIPIIQLECMFDIMKKCNLVTY
jgi:hypothetical protein